MYSAVYIILSAFMIFRNNVKIVSMQISTELSTIIDSTTEFMNFDDTELTTTFNESISTNKPIPSKPPSLPPLIHDYWMTQMGVIKDDLLRIQAIIVKDEDAETACVEGNQKSKKRYLMCAGSILNRNRVLTSASCLHEAMHIRHNVRAPLAVIIAPLRSTVQMIRVAEYRIHPKHDTNPYSPDHSTHNLAILSLACRISSSNYNKIVLPNQTMTHICTEENCSIAIYRKIGYTSNVIYQILAPHIPFHNRKRRRTVAHHARRNIVLTNLSSESVNFHRDALRIIDKRSTDGSRNCSQTGAPVMINSTQTAVVAVSCDDRQNSATWAYTDLYINLNWIHSILYDWNKTVSHTMTADQSAKSGANITGSSSKTCGNCIFNFYISVGCKEKGNCPKAGATHQSTKLSHIITTTDINTKPQPNVQLLNQKGVQPQNAPTLPSWKRGQISNNDIPRLLRSSFVQCPNNFPRCLPLVSGTNDGDGGAQPMVPPEQIHAYGIKRRRLNSGSKKIMSFATDSIIPIDTKIQSRIDAGSKYNLLYHKNNRIMNLSQNGSRIFRKTPAKLFKINHQNIYVPPMMIGKNKHVQNKMSNWLRRRHAATAAAAAAAAGYRDM